MHSLLGCLHAIGNQQSVNLQSFVVEEVDVASGVRSLSKQAREEMARRRIAAATLRVVVDGLSREAFEFVLAGSDVEQRWPDSWSKPPAGLHDLND